MKYYQYVSLCLLATTMTAYAGVTSCPDLNDPTVESILADMKSSNVSSKTATIHKINWTITRPDVPGNYNMFSSLTSKIAYADQYVGFTAPNNHAGLTFTATIYCRYDMNINDHDEATIFQTETKTTDASLGRIFPSSNRWEDARFMAGAKIPGVDYSNAYNNFIWMCFSQPSRAYDIPDAKVCAFYMDDDTSEN